MGITADTIRYYTRIGLLEPAVNIDNGYKIYGVREVRRLVFIVKAKALGFTISNIREIISVSEIGKSACPLVRQLLHDRIRQTQIELEEKQNLLHRMKEAAQIWNQVQDGFPSDDSLCCLIEESDERMDVPRRVNGYPGMAVVHSLGGANT